MIDNRQGIEPVSNDELRSVYGVGGWFVAVPVPGGAGPFDGAVGQ